MARGRRCGLVRHPRFLPPTANPCPIGVSRRAAPAKAFRRGFSGRDGRGLLAKGSARIEDSSGYSLSCRCPHSLSAHRGRSPYWKRRVPCPPLWVGMSGGRRQGSSHAHPRRWAWHQGVGRDAPPIGHERTHLGVRAKPHFLVLKIHFITNPTQPPYQAFLTSWRPAISDAAIPPRNWGPRSCGLPRNRRPICCSKSGGLPPARSCILVGYFRNSTQRFPLTI